ncbi:MAG: endonuclease MutS2 [Desulfitobacteriaceae bacterium]
MAIEDKVLIKLGFDKIRLFLMDYCILPRAGEIAETLVPFTDREKITVALRETDEGKELLRGNPLFSVRGAKEIRNYLERCQRGGALNPLELLELRDTLRTGRRVRQNIIEGKGEFSRLRELATAIEPQKQLEDEICHCINEDGAVADNATVELAEYRRSRNRLQQRIRDSLEGILKNSAYQKMLQDALITQRSERYVVPIKQEYRSSFPGIVHDQSGSGATLFIEPLPVVHLGNELREIIFKEQREIQKILAKLAEYVQASASEIGTLYEVLASIDFILAKVRLSEQMNAGTPLLVAAQEVKLVQARHPLIQGTVIPLTVELGKDFAMLVVTGPNTGGKTVALKTIGLLVAMTQAGLHIPAEGNSRIGIFTQIFVDVGDEQSLEQSLSTFSGHMKNIVHIVNLADQKSLVLLDEIGAGTDPTEGAALAMAILARLHEQGCRVVATTHYGSLKTFAFQTPGVQNASVEFDAVSLSPTYRLLVGIPGKSNAFSIAAGLGLNDKVLEKAKTFLTERELQVADLLENLKETQREIEVEKRTAEERLLAVEQKSKAIEQRSLRQDEDYHKLLDKAREEAGEIAQMARREAEVIIQELKEALKKDKREQASIEKARSGLKQLNDKLEATSGNARKKTGLLPEQFKLGMTVYMSKLRQTGQIIKLPSDSGELQVQAGVLKVTVPLSEVRLVQAEPIKMPRVSGEGRLSMSKANTLRNEINLRGMLVEEATYALDKYLDDAILSGINQIYVIHGKGTGALRAGVQEFLSGHPHVRTFRIGQHGEGDLGVTVVELN